VYRKRGFFFFLSSFKHEYNILEKAGSSIGRKHSDKTKQILSDAKKGEKNPNFGKTINHSDETKQILSEANKGKNHPNYGKTLSDETRTKISPEGCSYR